jgi:hypothetical protein
MRFPIIADSGANFHMFNDSAFFEYISAVLGKGILGVGKTSLDIKGVGTIKLKFGQNILTVENVRYVPSLAESIYSLFLHIQRPDHALHSSFADGLSIVFPTFRATAIIGTDDIYLDATPVNFTSFSMNQESIGSNTSSSPLSSTLCRHVTQIQDQVSSELEKDDNSTLQ